MQIVIAMWIATGTLSQPPPEWKHGVPIPEVIPSATYRGLRFADPIFANTIRIEDVSLEDCKFAFTTREPILGLDATNLSLRNCEIDELWIDGADLDHLTFHDCHIQDFEIRDSDVAQLEFNNCTVDRLVLTGLGTASGLTFSGCTIRKLEIESTERIEYLVFFRSNITRFAAARSGFYRPDFSDELLEASRVSLSEVRLIEPTLTADFVEDVDIRRLVIPRSGFVLRQELTEGGFGPSKNRELLREARGIYSVLERKFAEAGMSRSSRWCTYRKGVVVRKLNDSTWARLCGYVWNQEIRGHYGTSPWIVLRAGIAISIVFALVYALLGYTRIAWGALTPTSAMGKEIDSQVPRLIGRKCVDSYFAFLLLCYGFSLNQLLLFGTRAFSVDFVADSFRMTNWKYAKIGLGRIVGTVENMLGLALMFFFAQAFIRGL